MRVIRISEQLSVGSQPALADFSALADQGFKVVVNSRPNSEDAEQPGSAAEAKAAEAAGLAYAFVPVQPGGITEADVQAFQRAVERAPGRVFAHCKSGLRTLTLHVLGEVLAGRMEADAVMDFGREHGFDLSGATAWLARHAAQRPQVSGFYDARTSSIQYVVTDPATKHCAIIDPVLDYDEKSGSTATRSADALLAFVR